MTHITMHFTRKQWKVTIYDVFEFPHHIIIDTILSHKGPSNENLVHMMAMQLGPTRFNNSSYKILHTALKYNVPRE